MKIENEAQAYTLGLLSSSILDDDAIIIPSKTSKYMSICSLLLKTFKDSVTEDINGYRIIGDSIVKDIKSWLFDTNGDKLYPVLNNDDLQWTFIRGICDSECGMLKWENSKPQCLIRVPSSYTENITTFCHIPCTLKDNMICFEGTNCIDFLGKLYPHNTPYKNEKKYNAFIDFLFWKPCQNHIKLPECKVLKVDEMAVVPSKSKESDAGYDLTIIKKAKQMLPTVTLYDTGIQIQVSHGLYAEVVPRSSLSKSGYMLANSIGIIDRGYTGNIYIALIKVDPDAPDIELPFKCCQLIFRQQIHVNMMEVDKSFQETSRGAGGFGSTS